MSLVNVGGTVHRRKSGNPAGRSPGTGRGGFGRGRDELTTGSTPFGDRVKQSRMEKGMTAADLAAVMGVGASQITGIENRGIKPSFSNLLALAAALDVELDWLCEHDLKGAQRAIDIQRGLV